MDVKNGMAVAALAYEFLSSDTITRLVDGFSTRLYRLVISILAPPHTFKHFTKGLETVSMFQQHKTWPHITDSFVRLEGHSIALHFN